MARGFLELKRVKQHGGKILECRHNNNLKPIYILHIIIDMIMARRMWNVAQSLQEKAAKTDRLPSPERYYVVLIMTYVLMFGLVLAAVLNLISIIREKQAFLTDRGLVCYFGFIKYENSRFVWEQANYPNGVPNVLHVYHNNDKVSITVMFDSNAEAANELINSKQNIGYNAFANYPYNNQ
jgi:hypothetical protein